MRTDTPVYFQTIHEGEYDPSTGNYLPDAVTEVERYASVTSAKIETLNMVYGNIKQDALVVRLQQHYTEPFSYIRIDDKRYHVDYSRPLRTKQTYIVSEVQ